MENINVKEIIDVLNGQIYNCTEELIEEVKLNNSDIMHQLVGRIEAFRSVVSMLSELE